MTEVGIGTAIIAYIEPHAGQAQAFNRWYERDHMYAATTAGPGAFAGARWVATRACKAVRPAGGDVVRRPARAARSSRRCGCSTARRRSGTRGSRARWKSCAPSPTACSPGRDHLHTAVYRFAGERRAPRAACRRRPRSTIRSRGLVAIAVPAGDGPACAAAIVGPELPVALPCSRPERVILAERRAAAARPRARLHAGRSARRVARAGRAGARRRFRASGSRARSSVRSPAPTTLRRRSLLARAIALQPTKIYIHELIDIIGHNRARYMHHMTANWCPVGRAERNQNCFGVWATVGSTGAWPQVVNLWELDGWNGLAANFEHELVGGGAQDPSLAEWWSVAAELRRGGFDRIVVPEPWSPTIDELTAAGVQGAVYAHELVRVPVGRARGLPRRARGVGPAGGRGARPAVRRRVPGRDVDRHRGDRDLGDPRPARRGPTFERAWDDGTLARVAARCSTRSRRDVHRTLMVDAPLEPDADRAPARSERPPAAVRDRSVTGSGAAVARDLLDGDPDDVVVYLERARDDTSASCGPPSTTLARQAARRRASTGS